MEPKKSKRKDLENKKALFFEVGLAVSLLLAFAAFDIKTTKLVLSKPNIENYEVEPIIPITMDEPPKPEPILDEKKLAMLITDEIKITDIDFPDISLFADPSMLDTSKYKPMARIIMPEEIDPNEVIPEYLVPKEPTVGSKDASRFTSWVYSQIQYPKEAIENHLQGIVHVSFIIDKNGNLTNIKNLRSPDPILFDEVMRILKKSPKWEPGMQGKRPVDVSYQISISFVLQ